MGDRTAEFIVRIGGDDADIRTALDRLVGKVKSTATDLERTTANVELFKNTKTKVDETGAAFERLSTRAAEFRQQIAQIEGAGGRAPKELTDALKATEQQLAKTSREYNRQSDSLAKLNASLTKAGVDTSRLADEEKRLALATAEAAKQQQTLAAYQTLGVKSSKETADQVARLNAAYQTLRNSGAPLRDINAAQVALAERTRELTAEQGGLVSSFNAARGVYLGAAAAVSGVAFAYKEATQAAFEFAKQQAQIGTVTNLTARQLEGLTDGIRELSQTAGFDLKEGLQAAYDLLRQGVPAGNILEVLATADDAAKAGITSLGDAAKLAGILVRGFGIEADAIRPTLDGLFVAAKNGGATFAELAAGLGDLAPVAKATNTPVEQVAAAIQVMTRAGLEAPAAISQLQQILTRLAAPETVAQLRGLGIEAGGLVSTLAQISERGLSLGEIVDLGISSKRAAAGVAALTTDASALSIALGKIGDSSGALDKASESLNKLQSEAVERLVAALKDLQLTLGQIVTPSTQTIGTLTELVRAVNNLAKSARDAKSAIGDLGFVQIIETGAAVINPITGIRNALALAGEAARSYNADVAAAAEASRAAGDAAEEAGTQIAAATAAQAEAARAQLAQVRAALTAVIPQLQDASKTITANTAEAVASINAQLQVQLAAIDRLRNTEGEAAKQSVELQKKAASDRLAIIQKGAEEAIRAANLEAEARRLAAGKSATEIAKVERGIADAKKAVLSEIVKAYEAHVATLVSLETAHLNRVKDLNLQRIELNQSIEDKIREIRNQSLTAFEAYADKLKKIDENISKARRALAEGDLKAAEDYARKAIDLSTDIAKKVESNGVEVVTQLQAQETAVGRIRQAQEVLNDVIDDRVDAEMAGAKASEENLATTREQLAKVKAQLEEVNAVIAKGIEVNVTTNAAEAVAAAREEIDSLNGRNTFSTHTIQVVTVEGNASGGVVGEKVASLRRSGGAGRGAVQRFATGGAVFRRPAWTKVPGSGNTDTVPAALAEGSFVVRKAASRFYGDALMGRLARVQHFALGGPASSLPMLGGKIGDVVIRGLLGGLSSRKVDGINISDLMAKLTKIVEAARGLPHSSTGLDMGTWASALLQRVPFLNDEKLKALARYIDENLEGFLAGFEQARAFGVPSVAGEELLGWLFLNAGGRAARRGTDTIPAMLTPGEYVVNRRAVDHFGTGLLHAVNQMRISPAALSAAIGGPPAPRVRYFEDGGAVVASSGTAVATAPVGGASSIVVNVSVGAPLSEDEIRRKLLPTLRDIERRRA